MNRVPLMLAALLAQATASAAPIQPVEGGLYPVGTELTGPCDPGDLPSSATLWISDWRESSFEELDAQGLEVRTLGRISDLNGVCTASWGNELRNPVLTAPGAYLLRIVHGTITHRGSGNGSEWELVSEEYEIEEIRFRAIDCARELPGYEPSDAQRAAQLRVTPGIELFKITREPGSAVNSFGWALGIDRWFWEELDALGDRDGTVDPDDFALVLPAWGYGPAASCDFEDGKHKLALYGEAGGAARHLAAQPRGALPAHCGDWWESKQGPWTAILHRLEELEGGDHGSLLGCFEREVSR